ncbi:hypothetical protein IG631_02487 [Alternaria alternata]|nr:hypothetical protein IG631_02487 [Alternaria alternata]
MSRLAGNRLRTAELVDRLVISTEGRRYQPLGTMRFMILICSITRLIIYHQFGAAIKLPLREIP